VLLRLLSLGVLSSYSTMKNVLKKESKKIKNQKEKSG
jgi:hypothetical protein